MEYIYGAQPVAPVTNKQTQRNRSVLLVLRRCGPLAGGTSSSSSSSSSRVRFRRKGGKRAAPVVLDGPERKKRGHSIIRGPARTCSFPLQQAVLCRTRIASGRRAPSEMSSSSSSPPPRHPWADTSWGTAPGGGGGGEHRGLPPLITGIVVGVCLVLHALQMVGDFNITAADAGHRSFFSSFQLSRHTLCPVVVWESPLTEWPRILTSALFHANLWHLIMNMMSTLALGARLEKHQQFGSLWLLCTTISAILLTAVMHILLAVAIYQTTGNQEAWRGHSVGFSAVLFHYVTLECHVDDSNINLSSSAGSTRRSLFGFLDVPSRLYPWALYV
jgi:membrane associated rhomboid family serine protease